MKNINPISLTLPSPDIPGLDCLCDGMGVFIMKRRSYSGANNPNFKHGFWKHPLYGVWRGIKNRCYYKKAINYYCYGGRGIKVCEEWDKDFETFYNWSIANGWKKGLTIDRIDNDGNYDPDNCRYTTMKVQINNRRPRTDGIKFFCRENGLEKHYNNIRYRRRKGKSFDEILQEYQHKFD